MVRLAARQGVYYLLTGVWPLPSIGSFQRVTGPKTDLWLVRTVGVLVAAWLRVARTGGPDVAARQARITACP
jgi:hypothetical protein